MSHGELLEAVWEAVPPGAEPEGFARRRAWLLERVTARDRVLDLGCGAGEFAAALAGAGARVVAVEVVAEPLRRARERFGDAGVDWRLAPLDGPLPCDDASFDVAWLGETLEHLVDPVGVLGHVRRALAPGGRLLATTPDHPPDLLRTLAADPERFAEHFSPRTDHLRFFNAVSLRALLEDLGLAVDELVADGGTLFAGARR